MIGKCNCGLITFEITGNIPAIYHCYCTLCQKQGGTASNAGTIVKLDRYRCLSGESVIQKWRKNTGFSSNFCNVCGSPVPNVFRSEYVWIPVGLIDGIDTQAVANIWLSSKPSWANSVELERNYDCAPEDLEEFVEFLSSRNHT